LEPRAISSHNSGCAPVDGDVEDGKRTFLGSRLLEQLY
jgi:hypothetical protein